jgi:hypothetical protein
MRWTTRTDWAIVIAALIIMLFCAWGLLSEPLEHKGVSSVNEEFVDLEHRVAEAERQACHIDRELSVLEATLPVPTPTPMSKIVKKE